MYTRSGALHAKTGREDGISYKYSTKTAAVGCTWADGAWTRGIPWGALSPAHHHPSVCNAFDMCASTWQLPSRSICRAFYNMQCMHLGKCIHYYLWCISRKIPFSHVQNTRTKHAHSAPTLIQSVCNSNASGSPISPRRYPGINHRYTHQPPQQPRISLINTSPSKHSLNPTSSPCRSRQINLRHQTGCIA